MKLNIWKPWGKNSNNNNDTGKRNIIIVIIVALIALVAAALYWIWNTGWKVPRIVIGGSDADLEAAKWIRIHKRWFLSKIWRDDPPFDPTTESELYVLVGGWHANAMSKIVNDKYFHFTVEGESVYDQEGNDLGNAIYYQYKNVIVIWGVHKEDTMTAAKAYSSAKTVPEWPPAT